MPRQGLRDIHMNCGENCYKGHRHSLCHGWSGGSTAWLSRNVLGIIPLEPGYSKVKIKPMLGSLKFAEGTFPVPGGIISVSHTKEPDGTVSSKINAPDNVVIVHDQNKLETIPKP